LPACHSFKEAEAGTFDLLLIEQLLCQLSYDGFLFNQAFKKKGLIRLSTGGRI